MAHRMTLYQYVRLITLLGSIVAIVPIKSYAATQLENEMSECATQQSTNQRLSCYDGIYTRLVEPRISSESNNGWEQTVNPSMMMEGNNVEFRIDASQAVKSRTQSVTPTLALTCENGSTSISIHWGIYLGKNRTSVLIRAGEKPTETTSWTIDQKYTVYYQGDSEALVQQLKQEFYLVVQIAPYNAKAVVARFNLSGLDEQIQQYSSSCDW